MSTKISGRKVLITGANRGLGRALSEEVLRRGAARVWSAVRKPIPARDLEDSQRVREVRLDVLDEASIQEAAGFVGPVDILINNAAVCHRGSCLTLGRDQLVEEWLTNTMGPLLVARHFAPQMQVGSTIVNVASQLVDAPVPAIGHYCATKSALLALSRCMEADLRAKGIRVLVVCPGAMDTDMSRPFPSIKQPVMEAAEEICDAIESESVLVPVGNGAKQLWKRLQEAPDETRREKAGLTFDRLFGAAPRP